MQYVRKIALSDVKDMRPIMAIGKTEDIRAVKERTGADIIINGGTYNMITGALDSGLIVDGVKKSPCWYGYAIEGNRVIWSYDNNQGLKHYVGAFGELLRDGELHLTNTQTNANGRTAMGLTDMSELVLYVVTKNDAFACSTPELAERMRTLGCDTAINLDGSYSSQAADGDALTLPDQYRPVAWYIGVWLNEGVRATTYINGAGRKTVYEDTRCIKPIGSLDPFETARMLDADKDWAVVMYNLTGTQERKVGFIKR